MWPFIAIIILLLGLRLFVPYTIPAALKARRLQYSIGLHIPYTTFFPSFPMGDAIFAGVGPRKKFRQFLREKLDASKSKVEAIIMWFAAEPGICFLDAGIIKKLLTMAKLPKVRW